MSNLLLACLDGFVGVKLKTRIHINLNIAPKDLQQKISCCFFFKQMMKNEDRNLWTLHSVTILRTMKRDHTFERSSNFDPSVNDTDIMLGKW